jgi:hypothetical protein
LVTLVKMVDLGRSHFSWKEKESLDEEKKQVIIQMRWRKRKKNRTEQRLP